MTRSGRRRAWPAAARAIWMSALLSALAVVMIAVTPWATGQQRLSPWRAPDARVEWIPAGSTVLPRYPVEGETTFPMRRLPFGDASPVQIFHRFTLRSIPTEPWSLLLPEVDGQVRVHVNGSPMKDSVVSSAPGLARSSARSRLWVIPLSNLHAGENRIDILVDDSAMRAVTSGVYLGPQASLEVAALRRGTLIDNVRRLVLLLSAMAMAANLIAVVFRAPVFHLAIAAAFAAVGTRVLLASGAPAMGLFWPVADQLLVAGIALCAASAVRSPLSAASRAKRRGEAGLLALTGLLGTASLLAAGTGAPGATLIGAGTIAASVLYLAWMLCEALPRAAEFSFSTQVMAGCAIGPGAVALAVAVAAASGLFITAPPLAAELGLAVSLAVTAALATGVGLVAGTRQAARLLHERLDQSQVIEQQQLALDATARALELKTRQSSVLEERQRMARDVHDGIGGQLASLIAQVRLRRVSMEQVEQALVGGLSELRLLVDSLDLVGETLADALASFLVRARQQTAAAGVRLDWNQAENLATEIADPQWTLNLYRLMQEAITNALRHSGGDRISVSIEGLDGRGLSVRIEDNGASFDALTVKRGRGLANMAHRAAELGGTFVIEQAASGRGAVIRVDVPLPE